MRMVMLLASLGLSTGGCVESWWPFFDGIACTQIYVYGLNVSVTDENGDPVAGATLTLSDGNYSETMMEGQPGQYVGAGERSGIYSLTIEAAGFQTMQIDNIVVTRDICHVIPVSREVELTQE